MAEIYRSDIVRVDLDHALLRKHVGAILVTGDKLGNRFGAEIFRDGNPVDVTGCGVTAYFMRPGENAIILTGTASGSVAYVDLVQACYSKASSFTLTIKISYGGSTTALRVIDGYILLTQTDDLVDPGDVVPTLDDIFAQIAAMETATERAQAATTDAIAAKDNANGAAVYAVNIATEKGDQAIQLAQEEADKQNVKIATLTEDIARNTAPPIVPTATGSIVTIMDGAERPAVEVISHIEPVQSGSGDASPDNVRPISGWDAVTATRAVKNQIDEAAMVNGSYIDGSGNVNANENYRYSPAFLTVKPGQDYVLQINKITSEERAFSVCLYDKDKNFIERIMPISTGSTGVLTAAIMIPGNIYYIRYSAPVEEQADHLQLEFGTTATAYEPYQGQTLSATLPETVYGGDVYWRTGKLLSDGVVVDGGSLNWVYWHGNMFYATIPNGYTRNVLCEVYPKGVEGATNGIFYRSSAPSTIYIRDDTLTNSAAGVAELKQKLSGHKIFYKKESPVEYQLTPQQFDMLKGTNNVWSDCGDTTLSYIADTKSYIDQRIAALLNA